MRVVQGSTGIKAPATVEQGQPVPVDIGIEGVDHILVTNGQPGSKVEQFPVGPGGSVSIPSRPQWPAGTTLFIYTNTVPVRGILVEIVPPQG